MNKNIRVIKAPTRFNFVNLRELWQYRELLVILALRDVKILYKQTLIGVSWVVIQPIMLMVVFSLVFGKMAKIPSDGIPYPVFTLAAILPWQFFAKSLTQGSISLVSMRDILTKVYFPRLIAPLSTILSGLVDFAVSFIVLIAMMIYFGIYPSIAILTLPVFVLLAILTAFAVSTLLAGINVKYRDVQFTLPFLSQLWMFATPVVYPLSLVPEKYMWLALLNPMTGVIEGFRWALLGNTTPNWHAIITSTILVMLLTIIGLMQFNSAEKEFADRV